MKWLQIETAPKDATPIDLWVPFWSDDLGRGHREVIGVVTEDSGEIVAVPGGNPVRGKMRDEGGVH